MKAHRSVLGLLGMLLLIGPISCTSTKATGSSSRSSTPAPARFITVVGQGQVTVPATSRLLVLAISVLSATPGNTREAGTTLSARQTVALASRVLQSAVTSLTTSGVSPRAISTQPLQVATQGGTLGTGTSTTVTTGITARLTDADQAATLIDAVVAKISDRLASANVVQTRNDGTAQAAKARAAALVDAKAQATALAKATGLSLGSIQSVSEGGTYQGGSGQSSPNDPTMVTYTSTLTVTYSVS
jgi:uncharacterized protein YggE